MPEFRMPPIPFEGASPVAFQEQSANLEVSLVLAADRYVYRRASGQFHAEDGNVRLDIVPDPAIADGVIQDMAENYQLLEHAAGAEFQQEPGVTICVPDAILIEDVESTISALKLIQSGSRNVPGGAEVLLWANYSTDGNDGNADTARARYSHLRQRLREEFGQEPGFSVDVALKEFPKEETFFMTKMRQSYMDAVVLRSLERGDAFTHPVIWLDADTMDLSSPDLIPKIAAIIRGGQALFARSQTHLGPRDIEVALAAATSNAEKIALLCELQKRLFKEHAPPDVVDSYVEEWGFGFGLGAYLWGGGLNTDMPYDETPNLIRNTLITDKYVEIGPRGRFNVVPHDYPLQLSIDGQPVKSFATIGESVYADIRRKIQLVRELGVYGIDEARHGGGFGAGVDLGQSPHIAPTEPRDKWVRGIKYAGCWCGAMIMMMNKYAGLPLVDAHELKCVTADGQQMPILEHVGQLTERYLPSKVDLKA